MIDVQHGALRAFEHHRLAIGNGLVQQLAGIGNKGSDAIGDLRSTLRARYGEKVLTPVIAPASGMLSGLLGRRSPGACALAAFDGIGGLPDDVISALETRAIWAKFGF